MDLNALLRALGYLHSERHWVTPETADPRLANHYRLAQRAGEEVGEGAKVVGSYVCQTSVDDKLMPPRPVVFVAYAANDEQARGIHKRLWNLGDCPFVLIVSPGAVRVYTGFNYIPDNPKRTLLLMRPTHSRTIFPIHYCLFMPMLLIVDISGSNKRNTWDRIRG